MVSYHRPFTGYGYDKFASFPFSCIIMRFGVQRPRCAYPHADSDLNSDLNCNCYAHGHAHSHGNGHAHRNPDCVTYGHLYTHDHSHA